MKLLFQKIFKTPVVTEPAKAVAALNWVVTEMEQRYQRMSMLAVRNINAFNDRVRSAQKRVGAGSPATGRGAPCRARGSRSAASETA